MRLVKDSRRCAQARAYLPRAFERLRAGRFSIAQLGGAMAAMVALLCALAGCGGERPAAAAVEIKLSIQPAPPRVGTATVSLTVTDRARRPVSGASLVLEASMNHAGMQPAFAALQQTAAGRYEGTLALSMAGDWVILVSGHLADGARVDERIDLAGVAAR